MSDVSGPENGFPMLDRRAARLASAAVGTAVCCLGPLVLAAAIPLALAGSITALLAIPIIGSSGTITNGLLWPADPFGPWIILIVRWTAYLLALVLALAVSVVIATGCLLLPPGRPLPLPHAACPGCRSRSCCPARTGTATCGWRWSATAP
jgi:hypothetical protein